MPVPADELAKAKNYIALGFPSEFEATTDLSRRLEELIVYRLPDDYFERYVANVMAVTAESVRSSGGEIHPAIALCRGRRRRPKDDRTGRTSAQSWTGAGHDGRRGAGTLT